MTLLSNTITVQNRDYETLASLLEDTMTQGTTYSIQIQGTMNFKVGDAAFTFIDKEFPFTQGSLDVYVSVPFAPAILTILENEGE